MRYYTSSQFHTTSRGGGRYEHRLNPSWGRLPALVYVDTSASTTVAGALDFFRAYFDDPPCSLMLMYGSVQRDKSVAWAMTWEPRLLRESLWLKLYMVADMHTEQETVVCLDYPLASAVCAELTVGVCPANSVHPARPCSLSVRPSVNVLEGARLSECEQRHLPMSRVISGPQSAADVVARWEALQAERSWYRAMHDNALPHTRTVQGVPHVSPRLAFADPFAPAYGAYPLKDAADDEELTHTRGTARQTAQLGVTARRVKTHWCRTCVFSCEAPHARATCAAPKTADHAEDFLGARAWKDPAGVAIAQGGFTEEQVWQLRWLAGAEVRLRDPGTGRARRYVLGQFMPSGGRSLVGYHCWRAAGDLQEAEVFYSFEDFREAVCDDDFSERLRAPLPAPRPAWLERAYAVTAQRRIGGRSGWGHERKLRYARLCYSLSEGYSLTPRYAYVTYEDSYSEHKVFTAATTAVEYLEWVHGTHVGSAYQSLPHQVLPPLPPRSARVPHYLKVLQAQEPSLK